MGPEWRDGASQMDKEDTKTTRGARFDLIRLLPSTLSPSTSKDRGATANTTTTSHCLTRQTDMAASTSPASSTSHKRMWIQTKRWSSQQTEAIAISMDSSSAHASAGRSPSLRHHRHCRRRPYRHRHPRRRHRRHRHLHRQCRLHQHHRLQSHRRPYRHPTHPLHPRQPS